jgi:hypothetical protein
MVAAAMRVVMRRNMVAMLERMAMLAIKKTIQ